MRTKTLLITGALTALSSAALMAQTNVYSLNAVGYINVTAYPGFTIIADQLIGATNNQIVNLFPNGPGSATVGAYDGLTIYKFSGGTYTSDVGDSQLGQGNTGWDFGGVITLNPGEAAWINNPRGTNVNLTFVGTVPTGPLSLTINGPNKFNLISSIVPQSGDLITNMGLTNFNVGDTVYVFNYNAAGTVGSYTTYSSDTAGFGAPGSYLLEWDAPGDPQVNVGQGFWYHTGVSGAGFTWTRNFSVN
jgi:hypothetical protein